MIALQVARMITNFVIFLELSDEETLDLDASVEFSEYLGAQLQVLDREFLRELINAFSVIVPEYTEVEQSIARDMSYAFYLEEALAADDPVKLAELEALRDARED